MECSGRGRANERGGCVCGDSGFVGRERYARARMLRCRKARAPATGEKYRRVTLQGPKGKNKNSRLDREVSGGPGCALRFPAYEGAMIAAVAHQQRPHWQWPENLLRAPDAGLFC